MEKAWPDWKTGSFDRDVSFAFGYEHDLFFEVSARTKATKIEIQKVLTGENRQVDYSAQLQSVNLALLPDDPYHGTVVDQKESDARSLHIKEGSLTVE